MANQDEMLQVITWHLGRKGKGSASCPVCQTAQWSVAGPAALVEHQETAGVTALGPRIFPLVVLACNNCHFTLQFLWEPIRKEYANDPGK